MLINSTERIQTYTQRGWWGTETIGDIFQRTADRSPDVTAVVDPPNRSEITDGLPQRLTYAQLRAAVDQMATALLEEGLRKDDILVVQLPNIVELVVIYLAAARLGIVVSPFPVQFREYEWEQLVNGLEAKACITASRIGKHAHAAMVAGMRHRLPALSTILVLGEAAPQETISLDTRLAAIRASGEMRLLDDYLSDTPISANDVFTICWTSGTESKPKGVPRSHNEWLVIGEAMEDGAALDPACSILNPFPLVNMAGIGGMMMSWLLNGGKFVLHHPLSLPVYLQQIAVEAVNFTVAPPALLNLLLQNEALLAQADIHTIKTLGSGSAPLSPWMVRTWQEKYGIYVVNFFGSNEGATFISGPRELPDPEQRARFFPRFGVSGLGWSARIADRMESKLVDLQTGETITAPGRPGEMLLRGAAIFAGYYHADNLNQQAFDADGYFRTSDLFEIADDANGDPRYYRYVGRSKDIIIRGGMNISPEEVETLIQSDPHVAEVAIVGYPDDIMGERACAIVVPKPGETVTLDTIAAYLREKGVAAYKIPERLVIMDTMPRNAVGKVLKFELRKRLKEASTM